MRLSLPSKPKAIKVLLPPDPEDVEYGPERLQAAKEACWRERYRFQFETQTLVSQDGRIVLPTRDDKC